MTQLETIRNRIEEIEALLSRDDENPVLSVIARKELLKELSRLEKQMARLEKEAYRKLVRRYPMRNN